MRWRFLLPLAVVCALIGLLAVGLGLDPRKVPSPLIGKPAPEFRLPVLGDGQRQFGNADLRGEVCLLNVWASWCVSCREEHPLLMALAAEGQLPVYGLNYKDSWADGLDWLRRSGDPYRLSLFDADGRVGVDWGVYGVPETFVLDRQGRIRYKHIGALRAEDLERIILPLVAQLRREN